jgi:hypothetical protein
MSVENTLLVDTAELDSLRFSKPKKCHGNLMVSKIKKSNELYLVQFPKMSVVNVTETVNAVELEFTSQSGYSKKVISFLAKLDTVVKEYISKYSEDWFGKTIPVENVNEMYKGNTALKFVFDKKTELTLKDEPVNISELVKGSLVECICQMKYLVFTKETCFIHWEICSARLHKKLARVPKFGFIEDPTDGSDSDSEEIITFF